MIFFINSFLNIIDKFEILFLIQNSFAKENLQIDQSKNFL